MALLSLQNAGKTFEGIAALDDVSFEVEPGEIAGIIGPNGSGKTTLLNVMTGVHPASSGRILFRGRDITNWRVHRIARLGMARTFQNIRLFGDLSVIDNVLVGLDRHIGANFGQVLLGLRGPRAAERRAQIEADALLRTAGAALAAQAARPARQLAYADKRRLEIARALAARPALLLLDEPAAGMSPQEIRELAATLRTLPAMGLTVLLIEHKMSLIEGVTNRVIVLDRGKKIADGPFAEVRRDRHVVEAYLGRSHSHALSA